ncbi:outer membrane protein assembly factor BamB family protein [Stieleria varia]|uniref:Outer membrane biogenesis protein BamB n=1 Tax=Stieleria varia TaxID=2528005 RepID=A0A5C6B862_9BACT|nr:PQQ-binding-like beta-propeller repeat protein [Stieleria varia]TWU07631.1 outer membrane biogenesis protein BamB [Stieleria varia]
MTRLPRPSVLTHSNHMMQSNPVKRTLSTVWTSCVFLMIACMLHSQHADGGEMMSPAIASQLQLEEAWRRQTSVPGGEQSIVDQQVHVHQASPRVYVEIVKTADAAAAPATDSAKPDGTAKPDGNVLFRIPTDQADTNGLPIGEEEAKRLARAEIRRLTRRGITAEITTRSVPRVNLYTACDDGTIECRNAETGEPIWLSHVGDPRLVYGTMGIGDEFLTITNGGNLIKLDISDGVEVNSVRTSGTPLYGAIHSGSYSLVATIRSSVEGYPLGDTTRDPFMEIVTGIALSPPTKAPDSTRVAWATDQGFVYVMELSGEPSVLFRLDTDGIVSGRIASASGNRFFFGSESGQVYGIRGTRLGDVLWSRPYGEPFYSAPMVVDDQVLLRSAYGNLYSLGTVDGISKWTKPIAGIDRMIGAFDGKLYVRTLSSAFAVIDLETGKMDAIYSSFRPNRLLVNRETNRLYFVNETGAVQCMRPVGTKMPTFMTNEDIEETPEGIAPAATQPLKMDPLDNPADPFGAADPFATPAAPAPAGGDPFGAGAAADPFAGGADAAGGGEMADPFGGDPFGN